MKNKRETIILFLVLLAIVAAVAIKTSFCRKTNVVAEGFDESSYTSDITNLKSDVARLALALKEQNFISQQQLAPADSAIDVSSALSNTKAVLEDEIKLVSDNLNSTNEKYAAFVLQQFTPLQNSVNNNLKDFDLLQSQVVQISNTMMSDADKNTILTNLDSIKNDISTLSLSDAALALRANVLDVHLSALEDNLSKYNSLMQQSQATTANTISNLEDTMNKSNDLLRQSQAATTGSISNLDASYQKQFTDLNTAMASIRNTDLVAIRASLANFGANGILSLEDPSGDFLTIDSNRMRLSRPTNHPFTIGQSAAPDGTGFVADLMVSGQTDNSFHGISFGGTMSEPAVSSVIAEQQLAGGTSEMLLAKFGEMRPSSIRHHAGSHRFSVPVSTTNPVPTSMQNALGMSNAGSNVVMEVRGNGVAIGDYMLMPKPDGLHVCNNIGTVCKNIYPTS